MKVAIISDHSGIEFRKEIISFLEEKGYEVLDLGTDKEKDNYALKGIMVAENVKMKAADFGIAICGTGIGISIAANKIRGIRCALVSTNDQARLAREHNDANIIALGAREIDVKDACTFVETFLTTKFEGGRHSLRVDTITDYEKSCIDC
ncbi:MAG: ribose 5-phosphate isomerase B [Mycoplasmatales bacterium]